MLDGHHALTFSKAGYEAGVAQPLEHPPEVSNISIHVSRLSPGRIRHSSIEIVC